MNDVDAIAKELSGGRLSRRGLVERLKGLGLGFGAALALGVAGAASAQAATAPDAAVTVTSTNAAINSIIQQAPQTPVAGVATPAQQVAWYHRYFRRFYTRYYNRY
jgi:mannose/fructose/N-acetylgalactosamine-specific phosphotransferase system component IIC